jgi:C4-dicarboxylate-specific signal transduction histidine kinase
MNNPKSDFDMKVGNAVAEVVESIAHQWRQPLAQINALVSSIDNILYEKKIEDLDLESKLDEIEHLTRYMSDTIEDFKKSLYDNSVEEIRLDLLLKESLELVANSFEQHGIEIIEDLNTPIVCRCLPNKLKQIVIVLLNNAKDAHLIRNTFNPNVELKLRKKDDEYIITLRDNGGGIAKSVQEKMFDPHYTTKHTSEGTGIGLYMAKKIIEDEYKGSIEVKNVAYGSCFTINLPAEGEG